MVTQLIEHERIRTTVAKAKEVRRVADKMVTLGKKGESNRLASSAVGNVALQAIPMPRQRLWGM